MRIEMFGTLRAIHGQTVVTHFRSHNDELVLVRLAMRPSIQVARLSLGIWLWPNHINPLEPLRTVLKQLRQTLGQTAFHTVGHKSVGLAAGVTSDVDEFERECGRARHAQLPMATRIAALHNALTLHHTDFLATFFDNWVVVERDRLKDLLFQTLVIVIRDCQSSGHVADAHYFRQVATTRFPGQSLPAPVPSSPTTLLPTPPATTPSGNGFFGRQVEVAILGQFVCTPQDKRLLTVTGTGGMGKTRLVREALLSHPVLLGFVSLVERTNSSDIWDALRDVLKLPATGHGPVEDRVVAHLKNHENALLIIDNAEHLLGNRENPDNTLPNAITSLLDACPTLKIVITSRRPLKIKQEQVLDLQVLPLNDAESLFLDRARAVNPQFATTPAGLKHVREICDLLEWVPLALEIAAARAYLVTPAEMERELERTRLTFLATKRSRGEARHSSVRVALEWSYNLLDTEAQRVFRQTGAFRGGFTLEAIRAVADNTDAVLDALEDLILHSLLSATPDDYVRRFSSLETVRELAALLLAENKTEEASAQAKHADFYTLLAKKIGSLVEKGEWGEATNILRAERANFNVVTEYASKNKQSDIVSTLLNALPYAYVEGGYWQDADRLLDVTELITEETSANFVRLLSWRAVLARRRGNGHVAWQSWHRILEVYQKQNATDRIRATQFEIAGQAIDEGRWDTAAETMTILREELENASLPLDTQFTILVLNARLYFKIQNGQESLFYANKSLEILRFKRENIHASCYLYGSQYLLPIYRQEMLWEEVDFLLTNGIEKTREVKNLFLFGVLMIEQGQYQLLIGNPFSAVQSFWYAHEIHKQLGSRLEKESKHLLQATQDKYGDLPSIQRWLESDPDTPENFFR
jgi:predicted ATPase